MLNPIASLGVYLAEMVICYFFFSDIFERRTTSLKCLVIGSVIFSAGSALNLLFNNNSMINSLTTFVIIFNAYRLNAASHNILKKSGLLDR